MPTPLGKLFKDWRGQRTQKEAAPVLGVDQTTLCYWESGKKRPHLLRAKDIEEKTGGAVTEEAIKAAHRKKKR